MKKTLFLSAILATALCSSTFGATSATVDVTSGTVDLSSYNGSNLLNGETEITITMSDNTVITNGTASCGSTKVQTKSITLAANGAVNVTATTGKEYGMLASGWGQSTINLNGGTLEKTGAGDFFLLNTSVNAGTIKVSQGSLTLTSHSTWGSAVATLGVQAADTDFTVSEGAQLRIRTNEAVSLKTLSMTNGTFDTAYNTNYTIGSITLNGTANTMKVAASHYNASTFTGHVSSLSLKGTNLSEAFVIADSNLTTLALDGVKGALAGSTTETNVVDADISLTNGDCAAGEWTTVNGKDYEFNGTMSGNGNFAWSGTANQEIGITFNGDISGWTSNTDQYSGLRAIGPATLNVTIGGSSETAVKNGFNADSVSGATSNKGRINLTIDRDVTMDGQIRINSLTVNASKTVSTTNNTVIIQNGITVKDNAVLTIGTSAAKTTESLTLGSGATLTLGTAESHNNNLNVTSSMTVEGNSTLNANLVMNSGVMSFAHDAQLTMGCSVIIGDTVKVVLTDEDIATIQSGQTVDLILDAEQITLGSGVTELSNIYRQNSDGTLTKLSSDFKIVADYDNKKVYAMPEPATATLSLLALAGLCARRRRH